MTSRYQELYHLECHNIGPWQARSIGNCIINTSFGLSDLVLLEKAFDYALVDPDSSIVSPMPLFSYNVLQVV